MSLLITPSSASRQVLSSAALLLLTLLVGCASPTHRAPVEERKPQVRPTASTPSASGAPASAAPSPVTEASAAKPPPGQENAGKPGFYSVKPGDTLIRISLDNGQNWRDVARWNGLDNPNVIEVGQVLRVAPPAADLGGVVVRPVAGQGRVETKPLDASKPTTALPASAGAASAAPAPTPSTAPAVTTPAPAVATAPAAPTAPTAGTPRDPEEDIAWAWPASGPVAAGFDEAKSKGLAITGKAGDSVVAAADGRVVYAGSGLRGYGNLVIVKHNATFLTAYAHNQTLLVKEDQAVRRGQKIAEMGSSDAERVQLHFEIRRQGKPVDPAKLLPVR